MPAILVLSIPGIQRYSSVTSTRSPSFCMTTLGASLTNHAALLLQSRDCYCHVSRPTLAPLPFHCRNTLIYAHMISRIVPPSNNSLSWLTLPALKLGTLWNYSCYTPVSHHSFVVNCTMVSIYDTRQTETTSSVQRRNVINKLVELWKPDVH
jgi:hypothetical protein